MHVKEINNDAYLVVAAKYWDKYGMDAFVDRVCWDLEEAKYVRSSLERADGMSFVIIKGGKEIW